ncbi:MAG: RNA polymerase factor sigma-32 [Desulfovibrio sp.]|jgi:RNA polymerase sigma-32 factor|nr:RNA polymerase factor sigma-32 [Desulfovibrio sp.]
MSAPQKQAGEPGNHVGRGVNAGRETSEAAAVAPSDALGAKLCAPEVDLPAREDAGCVPDAEVCSDDVEDLAEELAEDAYAEPAEEISASSLPLPAFGTDALAPFLHRPPEKTRDSFQIYLREINKFPLLKPEEESELARRVRDTGDADAAFRLIASHLRLVVRIAMDFQRRWMQNVLDLVQEGNVGLVRAVSKFDPDKGIKFSYYAAFWIKAYILKFIMDNWRMVKIGTTQTQRKLFYNLNRERRLLTAQGFDPDSAVLAERLNVPEDQVIEMAQRLDASDMSLDAPVSGEHEGGASRMDYLPALGPGIEATLADAEIADLVRERLISLKSRLNDKELYILEKRLLAEEPVTLREIGDFFAVTRERVRQIEARLLQKVRDHLFNNIKDFSRDWIER